MKKISFLLFLAIWISYISSFLLTEEIILSQVLRGTQGIFTVLYFMSIFPLGFDISGTDQIENLTVNAVFSLISLGLIPYQFNSFIFELAQGICLITFLLLLRKIDMAMSPENWLEDFDGV